MRICILVRSGLILLGMAVAASSGCRTLWREGTITTSPNVEGHVVRTDGKPVSGMRVALTTEPDNRDPSCRRAARLTTTDSAGTFDLRRTTTRMKPAWFTGMHVFQICVGSGDSAFVGYEGVMSGADSTGALLLRCVVRREPAAKAGKEWPCEREGETSFLDERPATSSPSEAWSWATPSTAGPHVAWARSIGK